MPAPIITFTSDMGLRDHYVAAVKGAILTECPEARIIDISHQITPFDIAQAAYVLRNAFPSMPKGSIHIIGVNPEADGQTPHLIVRHAGHYFIGADNGIFSLLFDAAPEMCFEMTMRLDADRLSFPTKQVFVKAACHLARGGTPEVIGRKVKEVKQLLPFLPVIDGLVIRGSVLHIDHYGNVVTNIDQSLWNRIGKGRKFVMSCGRSENNIDQLHNTYGDVPHGERVAFFGDNELLQFAVNKGVEGSGGGAARLFGLHVQDPVHIQFKERDQN